MTLHSDNAAKVRPIHLRPPPFLKIGRALPQPQRNSTSIGVVADMVICWTINPPPYFDESRWKMQDDPNILKIEFLLTEDNFSFTLGNLGCWALVCNIILGQLDKTLKITSIYLKMEDNI